MSQVGDQLRDWNNRVVKSVTMAQAIRDQLELHSKADMSKASASEIMSKLLIDIDHNKVNYADPVEAVINIVNSLDPDGRKLTIFGDETPFFMRNKMYNLMIEFQRIVAKTLLASLDLLQDNEPLTSETKAAVLSYIDVFLGSVIELK